MIQQYQSDYSMIKSRYEALRENSRKIAHDELPAARIVKNYYLSKKGFSYNQKEDFCFTEV